MKKQAVYFFIITFIGNVSLAQNTVRHLSLQEAITASVANNNAFRLSELDVQVAKSKLQQANTVFLPQVDFSYSAVTTNNPLNAFGFKLQQGSITTADFNPKLLNDPSSTPDFSAKFELQQPLVNIDKLYQRKGAAKQVEIAQLLTDRTKEYLHFEAEKAYMQLQMTYAENKVLNESLLTARVIYRFSKDYYEEGFIQKSDLLNAGLHVSNIEMQVKNSQSRIQDASDMLSLLMDQPVGAIYTTDSISITPNVIIDDRLPAGRADFQAIEKGVESYDMMIQSSKMSYLPRLNAFASYQWNDKNITGFNTNSYFAGVQLSWNIFNGNRTKNIISQQRLEKAKLGKQLDQQKRQAQIQVNQSRRQLLDASFDIEQQQMAIEQASESLRILQNRYEKGLVKTTDVLIAQTELAKREMGYVHSVFNYNMAAATLRFLTISK